MVGTMFRGVDCVSRYRRHGRAGGEHKAPCPGVRHEQYHLAPCKIWKKIVLNWIKIKKSTQDKKTNLKLFFVSTDKITITNTLRHFTDPLSYKSDDKFHENFTKCFFLYNERGTRNFLPYGQLHWIYRV